MTEIRHLWATFHQRYYEDQLIIIDLMAIEAVVQDRDHAVIHTGPQHFYQVYESVPEIMKIMRKHLDGRVT